MLIENLVKSEISHFTTEFENIFRPVLTLSCLAPAPLKISISKQMLRTEKIEASKAAKLVELSMDGLKKLTGFLEKPILMIQNTVAVLKKFSGLDLNVGYTCAQSLRN